MDICSSHLLCAPLTWFQHKNYQTWTNPRWKTKHRLDHWLLLQRRANLKRVVNTRIHAGMSLHSDHHPIMLELLIAANSGKRNGSTAPDRPQAYCLTDPETQSQFRRAFLDAFERSLDADKKEDDLHICIYIHLNLYVYIYVCIYISIHTSILEQGR